mgnify:FL=1
MLEFNRKNKTIDCDRAVDLGNGVWWVGFQDRESGLRCNPYLIIDGDEAILIDGGSRPDFPEVMMKILETGLDPRKISALIYDHYDPDLCGSIPNFEDMIDNPDLQLIASGFSHTFIRHYGCRSKFVKLTDLDYCYKFKSGRQLQFITTPYCHSRGSFVVFDEASKILFSGDLFGTYENSWQLFFGFSEDCTGNGSCQACIKKGVECRLPGYLDFHRKIMPSSKAVRYALAKVKKLPYTMIASQHGSIIDRPSAELLTQELEKLEDIGIDQFSPEE